MIDTLEHGPIRELRLARPPVNALDPKLLEALVDALGRAARDGASAVVLSGQPGMFSAGLDVPALLALQPAELRALWPLFFDAQAKIAASPVPVVAAITGHCPAGGTVLTLYCDHRVMARGDYRIGLNEVQIGLYAGPIIHRAFERLVGPRQAAQLLMRGALVSPEEAHAIGLVDELAAPEEVIPRALAYAQELVRLPARAFALTRELVRADLKALFGGDRDFYDEANALWFEPETQQRLRAAFARGRR